MDVSPRQLASPPNLLSLLRLLLTAPVVWLIASPDRGLDWLLLLLLAVAILTDFFDGYLSRKLDQESDLGKLLDPLADKVLMAGGLLALAAWRGFPAWLVLLLIYRDTLIVVLGLLVIRRSGLLPSASFLGKLNTTLFAVACLLFLIFPGRALTTLAIYVCAGTTLVSGVSYYAFGEPYLARRRAGKLLLRAAVLTPPALLVWIFR